VPATHSFFLARGRLIAGARCGWLLAAHVVADRTEALF